ncbi:hypothetical protein ACJX0J_039089, partial [Zea mays]
MEDLNTIQAIETGTDIETSFMFFLWVDKVKTTPLLIMIHLKQHKPNNNFILISILKNNYFEIHIKGLETSFWSVFASISSWEELYQPFKHHSSHLSSYGQAQGDGHQFL